MRRIFAVYELYVLIALAIALVAVVPREGQHGTALAAELSAAFVLLLIGVVHMRLPGWGDRVRT